MIPELAILPELLDRNSYKQYRRSVNLANVKNNMKNLYGVYLTLDKLMETVDSERFTVDDFEAYYWLQYPMVKKDEREEIQETVWTKIRIPPNEAVVEQLLREINTRAFAADLALRSFDVSIGKGSFVELLATMQRGSDVLLKTTDDKVEFVTDNLDDLLNRTVGDGGLSWPLKSLNVRLGPLRSGDMGVVFARPEVGKTTFLAQTAAFMATQIKDEAPILWFNNEERGEKVKLRIYQAALGRDISWILANKSEAAKNFIGSTGGRIKLIDSNLITYDFVERLCDKLRPALIVFDKLDHIKGFAAERKDLELETIYRWFRDLAKQFAPCIGVCHADGSAEGTKWLTMEHMDNAKTAKQATADWILGIGQTHDEGMEYARYFHLCKNKLLGSSETNPSLRHDRWAVIIKPDTATYEDTK